MEATALSLSTRPVAGVPLVVTVDAPVVSSVATVTLATDALCEAPDEGKVTLGVGPTVSGAARGRGTLARQPWAAPVIEAGAAVAGPVGPTSSTVAVTSAARTDLPLPAAHGPKALRPPRGITN